MHPINHGLMAGGVDCGIDACEGSHAKLLDRLADAARALPAGQVLRGWNYEPADLDKGDGRPVACLNQN